MVFGFTPESRSPSTGFPNEVLAMFQSNARVLHLLGWAAICLAPLMVGQGSNASKQREIKVPSIAGEPFLRLKISAERRRGIVSVRNANGTEAQSLECPLLRDNVEAKQEELAAVREQFAPPGSTSIAWRQLSSSEILVRYRETDSKL